MHKRQGMPSAVWSFLGDETGGTFMEFTLISAIVAVVLTLVFLAVCKLALPDS